jgi:hypothetical protein
VPRDCCSDRKVRLTRWVLVVVMIAGAIILGAIAAPR